MTPSISYKNGFMLLEIIISFLIVSISLGLIFQNISLSLSSFEKANSKLKNSFLMETIGMKELLKDRESQDIENISLKEWPFEVEDRDYKFVEISIETDKIKKNSIFLFLKRE